MTLQEINDQLSLIGTVETLEENGGALYLTILSIINPSPSTLIEIVTILNSYKPELYSGAPSMSMGTTGGKLILHSESFFL